MNETSQEKRLRLQRDLKSLTQSPEWITDPVIRIKVQQLRSELYPHVFGNTESKIQKEKKQRYQIW